MYRIGFDNDKYLQMQSEHIAERIKKFGGKLYLEFGGKLFDDFHAARVLPGFAPDSKIRMLARLKDEAEVVIAINAADIEKNKVRGDRIYTDVKSGLNAGCLAVLVMSGETDEQILRDSVDKPDMVLKDCSEITEALKA